MSNCGNMEKGITISPKYRELKSDRKYLLQFGNASGPTYLIYIRPTGQMPGDPVRHCSYYVSRTKNYFFVILYYILESLSQIKRKRDIFSVS